MKWLLAVLLLLVSTVVYAASPVPITLTWNGATGADGGYRFYLRQLEIAVGTVVPENLIQIGTAVAGATTAIIPLTLPIEGRYTVHAVALDLVGNQSDLSEAATWNDTTTVVYLQKPGKPTLKIRTTK
jgi:hypothetical protein